VLDALLCRIQVGAGHLVLVCPRAASPPNPKAHRHLSLTLTSRLSAIGVERRIVQGHLLPPLEHRKS
jgi:hypothetical protein